MQYRNLVFALLSLLLVAGTGLAWVGTGENEDRIALDCQQPGTVRAGSVQELRVGIENRLSIDIEVVGMSLC